MRILVMAKAPVPGLVKTRLCPPCTPEQAATLAEAALADTLEAALAAAVGEVVLALEGRPGPWLPADVNVVPQRGEDLGDRLANAWDDAGGPALQIGMDTPQVTAVALREACAALDRAARDAVLGRAVDGGWWAIGLQRADRRAFVGIRMSRADTGEQQLARLRSLGLDPDPLPVLQDVDTYRDASEVAARAAGTRFAKAFGAMAP
jgi:uncharacterized protein